MKITTDGEITYTTEEAKELIYLNEGLGKLREILTQQIELSIREIEEGNVTNAYINIQIADLDYYKELEGQEQ